MYFPKHYRWSHGLLIGLDSAPWGGAEIGEVNRVIVLEVIGGEVTKVSCFHSLAMHG